jgi:alanyl-tRNA synthetase
MKPSEPSFSRELCGGIHVRNTGEIGLFKITSEASAASGVRRIEAVTGLGAYQWVKDQRSLLEEAAGLLKSNPADLVRSVEKTLEALKEERKKRERLAAQGGGSQAAVESIGPVELAIEQLQDADPKDAQLVADRLVDGHPSRVALVALSSDGKLTFVCKVGDDAKAKGAHAGKLVGEVAKVAGGGGGGRPDFATAGGKDASRLGEALAKAREVLSSQVG